MHFNHALGDLIFEMLIRGEGSKMMGQNLSDFAKYGGELTTARLKHKYTVFRQERRKLLREYDEFLSNFKKVLTVSD